MQKQHPNRRAYGNGKTITTFEFDLGATLETKPYNRKSEQWLFFEPSGTVLTLRADQKYSYGNSSFNAQKWLPIRGA